MNLEGYSAIQLIDCTDRIGKVNRIIFGWRVCRSLAPDHTFTFHESAFEDSIQMAGIPATIGPLRDRGKGPSLGSAHDHNSGDGTAEHAGLEAEPGVEKLTLGPSLCQLSPQGLIEVGDPTLARRLAGTLTGR